MPLVSRRITSAGIEPFAGWVVQQETAGSTRHTGAWRPVASQWSNRDIWMDTSNDATVITPRRWTGTTWTPPAPDVAFFDPLTGADGDALPATYSLSQSPTTGTGGSATIQGGFLRLRSSNTGGYDAGTLLSVKTAIADRADTNESFAFKWDSTEAYGVVLARANSTLNLLTGYGLHLRKGLYEVKKHVANVTGVSISSGEHAYPYSPNDVTACRFYVVGTVIKVKLWPARYFEPNEWTWQGTDSAITAAGATGFTVSGGSAAVSSNWYLDTHVIEAP